MTTQKSNPKLESPLVFGSFRNWLQLLWDCKEIDFEYLPRILVVTLTTFLTIPLRIYEQIRFGTIIKNTEIHPSPIFIVGHWRTGTTHLHNLLCQDKRFGYVTNFQAMAPGFSLIGEKRIKDLLTEVTRKRTTTRVIDNIPLLMDGPQEEDFALANMSPYSILHLYTFPRQASFYFERYVLFNDLSAPIFEKWKESYLTILRIATIRFGGKRLIIKNPANSGRIKTLLKLFPNAKFIHIYRNPYNVYRSTQETYRRILPNSQLQNISRQQIDTDILKFYTQMMKKFLADKTCIPAGNLIEIKYEDLETTPLNELRKVYMELNIPDFSEVNPAIQAYLTSIKDYQKNKYVIDNDVISKVNQHWKFAFDKWGYTRVEEKMFQANNIS